MTFIAFLIFIPLQIAWLPISILAGIWVGYKQIAISKKLGVSQTAIEIINGRWTMHVFGMREDPAVDKLIRVLPNTSAMGLFLALVPLYVLYRVSGKNLIYPRKVAAGKENIADLVMARTPAFDALIDKHASDAKQFVLMGGGLDTRAYGQLAARGLNIFELDQATTQRLKIEQLARAGIDAAHVKFIEVDFAGEDWAQALTQAGFDPKAKTIFLWEGVTLYLDAADVAATIAHLKAISAPGSVLLADLYSRNFVRKMSNAATAKTLEATGEGLQFSLDFSADHEGVLQTFATEQGLGLGTTHFLGAAGKAGPFAVVAEFQLTA